MKTHPRAHEMYLEGLHPQDQEFSRESLRRQAQSSNPDDTEKVPIRRDQPAEESPSSK